MAKYDRKTIEIQRVQVRGGMDYWRARAFDQTRDNFAEDIGDGRDGAIGNLCAKLYRQSHPGAVDATNDWYVWQLLGGGPNKYVVVDLPDEVPDRAPPPQRFPLAPNPTPNIPVKHPEGPKPFDPYENAPTKKQNPFLRPKSEISTAAPRPSYGVRLDDGRTVFLTRDDFSAATKRGITEQELARELAGKRTVIGPGGRLA